MKKTRREETEEDEQEISTQGRKEGCSAESRTAFNTAHKHIDRRREEKTERKRKKWHH
jgi:hypothetical protein